MPLKSILDSRPPSPDPTFSTSRRPAQSPVQHLQHILRTRLAPSWLRLLLAYAIALLVFCLYGRANFYRDPGSIFFDEKHAYVRLYSQSRQKQADAFWKQTGQALEKHKDGPGRAGKHPSMCLAFMTVERKGLDRQYIETALSSTLAQLSAAERSDLHLKVLFASTTPSKHPSFSSPVLRHVVDDQFTYTDVVTTDALHMLQGYEDTQSFTEKGAFDYSLALRRCYETTDSPYIAVFEDDILLAEGWFARTLLGLQEVQRKMAQNHADSGANRWLYMRLFNQERSMGWGGGRTLGGNSEFWIIFGVSGTIATTLIFLRRKSKKVRVHVDNAFLAVLCLVVIPATVFMFFQAGKASLLPQQAGVYEEFFGCCSQALVFNREHVPHFLDYLREAVKHIHDPGLNVKYDMMTRNFAWQFEYKRWSQYPVMAQHLGVRSSIQAIEQSSQAVWSMAFENLDPKVLAKDHARMVEELYGSHSIR